MDQPPDSVTESHDESDTGLRVLCVGDVPGEAHVAPDWTDGD